MVLRSFFFSLGLISSEVIEVCPDEQVTTLDLLVIKRMHTFFPTLVNQLGLAIAHPIVDPYIKTFRNWFHVHKSSEQYHSTGDQI